jgi:hypothetical protein
MNILITERKELKLSSFCWTTELNQVQNIQAEIRKLLNYPLLLEADEDNFYLCQRSVVTFASSQLFSYHFTVVRSQLLS